jgi:hypothetical protein
VVLGSLSLVLLYFPNGRLPSRRWRVVLWLLAAAIAVLVVSISFRPSLPTMPAFASPVALGLPRWLVDAGFLAGWCLVWVVVVAAVASLLVRFTRVQGVQRQQLKWLTLATCLLAVLGVLAVVADLLGFQDLRENLAILFGAGLVAIPITVGIAILRHRLYDIDLLINRTLIYGLVTVTLGLAYAGTALLLGALFGGRSSLTAASATLVVAAAFQPVRRRIQGTVDRRFNRHKYDAARTIAAFSARLGRQVNLGELRDELSGVVEQTMQPTSFSLWLRPLGPDAGTDGTPIAPDDPLPARVQEIGHAVDLGSLRLDSPALRELRAAGTELVVPLISQGELIGMLNLGPRREDRSYTADDRALLGDLAGQAAPALRLTQLVRRREQEVREREGIDRELHVAQLIQQRFLPREPPELAGWRVGAYYGPARAVGGDFYDFIDLDGGRVGIVVGDATDKGVPAALVMAITHAILRAEAPRLEAPALVLETANELLLNETAEHMFVTCPFAVLDPASGALRFANAGHNLPTCGARTAWSSCARPACRSACCRAAATTRRR